MIEAGSSRADTLVREAHDRVYRFPPGLDGFRAGVRWVTDEDWGVGALTVTLAGAARVEFEGVPNDSWVTDEIRSIVSHRAPARYEDGDGAVGKQLGASEVLGERVELDDQLSSSYVVGEGRIELVSRAHDSGRFTIAVQQRTETGDGSEVSTAFTVSYWDDEGGLTRSEAYSDRYIEVDGVLLPSRRTVVAATSDGLTVRKLELVDHAPLDGKDA